MKEADFSKQLRDDMLYMLAEHQKEKNNICEFTRVPHVQLIRDSYNSGKKPYDFYFVYKSNFYALELKLIKGQSICFDRVSHHQIISLLEAENSGLCANGLIVLYLNDYDNKRKALVINILQWIRIIKSYSGKKSIKIKELLEEYPNRVIVMERIKHCNKLHWDVVKGIIHREL